MKRRKLNNSGNFKTAGNSRLSGKIGKPAGKKGVREVFEIHDLSSSLPAGSVQNKENCNRVLTSLPVCSLFLHAGKRQDPPDVG